MPLELLLALRYLKPKRTFVSAITMVSILGVTLGVAVLIIVMSVMSGFDAQLREKLFGFNAHLRIETASATMSDYRNLTERIAAEPKVKGVSPYILGPIVIETQTSHPRIAAPVLRGIDPEHESKISILPSSMIEGEFDVEGQGIVVGREFARALGLRIDEPIAIYSHNRLRQVQKILRDKTQRERMPLPDDYIIRGIFDVGYYEYNAGVIVCSIFDAQELFLNGEDAVHGLYVMLDNPYLAYEVKQNLSEKLGNAFRVIAWFDEHKSLLDALIVEKNMIRFLLFFIVLVAAFGIANSQITFVVQKTREIGMLKALGANARQVLFIFLGQSILVGMAGVITGLGLGILAIEYRNEFLLWMNRLTDFNLFPPEIYGFTRLPAILSPADLLVICVGSLLICAFAGVLPAINASRLKPVESLRHT